MEGGRQLGSIAPWDLSLSWLGQQLALQPSGLHSSGSCAQKPSPESAFSLPLRALNILQQNSGCLQGWGGCPPLQEMESKALKGSKRLV